MKILIFCLLVGFSAVLMAHKNNDTATLTPGEMAELKSFGKPDEVR